MEDQNNQNNSQAAKSRYGITKQELSDLVLFYIDRIFSDDLDELEFLGGTEALEQKLCTNYRAGLTEQIIDKQQRTIEFDANFKQQAETKSFCSIC